MTTWQTDSRLDEAAATHAVVLGLGGNLGGVEAIVARFAMVADALTAWGTVTRSRLYATAPVDAPGPEFINAALAVVFAEFVPLPTEWLGVCRELERRVGRVRSERNAPRTLDLDVLLWGTRQISQDAPPIVVPHPRLARRRFALMPCIDLLGASHSVVGSASLGDLLAAAPPDAVRVLLSPTTGDQ